jgi:hypothetical protein
MNYKLSSNKGEYFFDWLNEVRDNVEGKLYV